jgi:hypothetical protein
LISRFLTGRALLEAALGSLTWVVDTSLNFALADPAREGLRLEVGAQVSLSHSPERGTPNAARFAQIGVKTFDNHLADRVDDLVVSHRRFAVSIHRVLSFCHF